MVQTIRESAVCTHEHEMSWKQARACERRSNMQRRKARMQQTTMNELRPVFTTLPVSKHMHENDRIGMQRTKARMQLQ